MATLSIGKLRGLQQTSTHRNVIAALAADQRGSLQKALGGDSPDAVTYSQMADFKAEVARIVAPAASAMLLDPIFGAHEAIGQGALPNNIGLLVAVEETGYEGDATSRRTALLPQWSVAKIKRMGAQAVKLLIYYHPDSDRAAEQEALLDQVIADCREQDIPLFVEPLSYSIDPAVKTLPNADRRRVVIATARQLIRPGVDILKAEFPVDAKQTQDEAEWADACAELTEASPAPWVLLSAGVDFSTYIRQVQVALNNGCSGVLAGRAVWKEATTKTGLERTRFLETTARERMQILTDLCNALGRPWSAHYSGAGTLDESWYAQY